MGGAGVERREVDEREEIQVECLKTTTQLCFFHLGECSNTTKSAIVGKLGTPKEPGTPSRAPARARP